MSVLIRHTIQSIKKSPIQTVFILIAMAVISASFLIALAVPTYFQQISSLWKQKQLLNSDLYIDSAPLNVRQAIDGKLSEYNLEAIEVFSCYTSVETNKKSFEARLKLTELEKFNRLTGADVISTCPASEGFLPVYLSSDTMEDFDLSLGDTFSIKTFFDLGPIEEGIKTAQVVGVCKCSMGYLSEEYLVYSDLGSDYEEINCPSELYLFLTDPSAVMSDGRTQKQNFEDAVNQACRIFPQYSESYVQNAKQTYEYFNKSFDRNVSMVILASVVLCIMMAFLLFFSYTVVAKSRAEEMVLFKAAGATPAQCTVILLAEVFLYALAGCSIGLVFGQFVVNYLSAALDIAISGALIQVEPWKYLTAISGGIVISLLSCLFPAVAVGKKSVRTLTGGELKITKYTPKWLVLALTVAVIAVMASLFVVPDTSKFYVLIAIVGISNVWTLAAMPWFFKFICKINGKMNRRKESAVASMGLFNNGAVSVTAALSAIVIGFVWLCVCVLTAVKITAVEETTRHDYDFSVVSYNENEEPLQEKINGIRSLDGVEQAEYVAQCSLSVCDKNLNALDEFTVNTYCVENSEALNMLVPDVDNSIKDAFDNTERGIILTYDFATRCGLKEGDKCRLYYSTDKQSVLVGDFTVVGLDYTLTKWNYSAVIKSADYVLENGKATLFKSAIWIKGDKTKFGGLRESIDTDFTVIYPREGIERPESHSVNAYSILDLFINIIYVVTALGLFELISVTAINRKREIEIFRLIGMTKRGTFKMAVTEALLVAVSAFLFGFVLSVGVTQLKSVFTLMMDKYIPPVYFDLKALYIALIVSAGTFVVWMISPALALKKKNDTRRSNL